MYLKTSRRITLISIGLFLAFSATSQHLNLADSLFDQKKFTEANEIFESLYHSDKSSPAMLLKMAYIQEGLENPAQALIYLNEYYSMTANKRVLEKMRTIAEEYELSGYEYSDLEFFTNVIDRFKGQIIGVLLALSIMVVVLIYTNQKKGIRRMDLAIAQLAICILVLFTGNNLLSSETGIINKDQTLLMSGPSAGAEPIEMLNRGHKISVTEVTDAWIKVRWADQTGYIRKNRIHII